MKNGAAEGGRCRSGGRDKAQSSEAVRLYAQDVDVGCKVGAGIMRGSYLLPRKANMLTLGFQQRKEGMGQR